MTKLQTKTAMVEFWTTKTNDEIDVLSIWADALRPYGIDVQQVVLKADQAPSPAGGAGNGKKKAKKPARR